MFRQQGLELGDAGSHIFTRVGAGEEPREGFLKEPLPGFILCAGIDRKEENPVRLGRFTVAGSIPDHQNLGRLIPAARSEFKHLQHYYFHNFVYERLWRDNARRWEVYDSTWQLLHTYAPDYRLVIVGDASMSPYEILQPGGSVEHWNEEAGEVWLKRLTDHFRHAVWLNPVPEAQWGYVGSIDLTRERMGQRMFPMTIAGLNGAVECLRRAG